MTIARGFPKKHPVRTYFALTLAISWSGLLMVGGAGFFAGSRWQTDPRFLPAIQTMLLGPPVAGILSTVLFSGTTGLRELLVRLIRWRVHGRWYAVCTLFVLAPPTTGMPFLVYSLAFVVVLWLAVAVVARVAGLGRVPSPRAS